MASALAKRLSTSRFPIKGRARARRGRAKPRGWDGTVIAVPGLAAASEFAALAAFFPGVLLSGACPGVSAIRVLAGGKRIRQIKVNAAEAISPIKWP